jgi:Tol biopolymer transport system component/DNA-binding winged helix-turn-helix (wHTH) protein
MRQSTGITYRFNGFSLDPLRRLLFGADGRPIPLTPRVFDTLLYLVEHRGDLLDKRVLLDAIWPNVVVEENNLNQAISTLRRVFGEKRGEHRFIVTDPGRGYRFVASVEVLAAGTGEPPTAPGDGTSAASPVSSPSPSNDHLSARPPGRFSMPLGLALLALLAALILVLPIYHHAFELSDVAALPKRQTAPARAEPILSSISPSPLTLDGGFKWHPVISPDAQKVAFSWNHDDAQNVDIYVKAIGPDTGYVRVTHDPGADWLPAWSPRGDRLAYISVEPVGVTIRTIPWTGGESTKVTDLAGSLRHLNYWLPTLSWSPDGRYLVYAERPLDTPARIVRFDLLERKKTVLSAPPVREDAVGDFAPSFSPDGSQIAFVRGPASYFDLDLWLMDADGRNARPLTASRMYEVDGIAWAHSGEILFTAGDRFKHRSYAVRPDQGVTRLVPGLGENDRWPSVAGNRLVFAKVAFQEPHLWQVAPRTTADRNAPLRDFGIDGEKVVFSRDGKRMAWLSPQSGRLQIWVADRNGANARPVTSTTSALDPQWSPNSREIVFWAYEYDENSDLFIIDVETLQQRRLTTHPADEMNPTFSHDGAWIYFCSNRDGEPQIYKMRPVADADAVAVTRDGGCHGFESSDGRYLYYEQFDPGVGFPIRSPVWRLTLGSEEPRVEVLPAWPRGERSWVLADGGIYWLIRGGGVGGPDIVLSYRDFATGASTELYRGPGQALYPSVSPDEATVLFDKDAPVHSDLYIIADVR